jgi:hypothetical protein
MQLSAGLSVPADWARADPVEQEYSLGVPLGYTPEPFAQLPRIGVILHAFHLALVAEVRAYVERIPAPADLFISTDTEEKRVALHQAFARWSKGQVEIRVTPNRGRDVAPKLIGFSAAHHSYDLVLHLHTKQSMHESGLAGWRGYLLQTLLGAPATVLSVFEIFRQVPSLGLLAPQHIDALRPWIRWGENYAAAAALAKRMDIALSPTAPLDFPAGSMFWARPAALAPLLDLGLSFDDFPEETGQTDGTVAHAIERLYFFSCEKAGFDWMKIAAPGLLHDERGILPVSNPLSLRRIVARTAVRLGQLAETEERLHGERARLLAFPPRPPRPSFILWRGHLGEAEAVRGRLAILPCVHQPHPGLQASIHAMATLFPSAASAVLMESAPTAWINTHLAAAFAEDADMVLVLIAPGLLHPQASAALLQMCAAHHGRSLLVPATVPDFSPPQVSPDDFTLPKMAGPVIAIPRTIFAAIGGVNEALEGALAWQDYATRAQEAGFALRFCPRALYMPAESTPRAGA